MTVGMVRRKRTVEEGYMVGGEGGTRTESRRKFFLVSSVLANLDARKKKRNDRIRMKRGDGRLSSREYYAKLETR